MLEIGTGSGYQACILAELGAKVFSIERQKSLFEKTSKLIPKLGYARIKTFYGDGYKGLPAFAPFDRTLVDQTRLTRDEVAWWNAYHAKVEAILAPQLSGDALAWLKAACAPL